MTATLKGTPARAGFRMPAESEPHAGCWMLWPERPDNWRRAARPAQQAFTAVATAISRFEPVTMGVSATHFAQARAQLPARIRVVELSHDDAWMRDVGPWGGVNGGLYASWDLDDQVAGKVLEVEGAARYRAPMINEGGAIHVDGAGTALVTEQCLLNRNRNPGLSRARIERHLQDYLGVSHIVWLGQGVFNDETDGHIDNLACFVRPGEVCLTWCDDPRDPQHAISRDALERLLAARDARGQRLRVHKLPMPGPLHMTSREAAGIQHLRGSHARLAGWRLAGSYVNFYLANGALVMPLLDPRTDRAAARVLKRLFPERKVVGVQAREILLGGGNIHCITQQVPG